MRKELMSRLHRLETAALPQPGGLPQVVILPDEDAPEYAAALAGITKRQAAGRSVIVVANGDDPLETIVDELEAV